MKILAIEHENPAASPADFAAHLDAEARRVWELSQAGTIREMYFRADRNEAVLVLECDSLRDAESRLAALPLVAAGLIRFELIPLIPYPSLARLFAPDQGR